MLRAVWSGREFEMLSVGRELMIGKHDVLCRECSWDGAGAELSTGLVKVSCSSMYRYVYRCPVCGSFDLARKGKVLPFRSHVSNRESRIEASLARKRATP